MAFALTRLKLFMKELGRVCGGRLAVSVTLAAGVSLTEGMGILLLAPLLSLAGAGSMPEFFPLPFTPTLEAILIVYAALVALRSFLTWFANAWNLELEHEFMHDLRVHIFSAAAGMEWRSWARQRPSHFLNAATVETERVGEAVHAFLSILNGMLLTAVYSACAFYLSWKLSLLALGSSALLFLLLKNASRRVAEDGERISSANDDFFHAAKDRLDGMKWIRENATELKALGELETASENVRRSHVRAGVRFGYFRGFLETAAALGLAATAYLALAVFNLPLASVLLYLVVFSRIAPRLMSIQQDWHEFAGRLPSFARAHAKTKFHEIFHAEEEPFEFSRELRFERVSFSYSETGAVLFRDASLRVARNGLTVVTGPSGAGKTTLADLASGLLFPESGHIEIDGRILTPENARAWRERIAVVTQDAFLFDDSVRANLLWTAPNASDEELKDALAKACAWEFVHALPDGWDTKIGENGIRLSGGERQRLTLARAILKKPSLFILDEPASALDADTADRIAENLADLAKEAGVLCFMHRIPAVWEKISGHEISGTRIITKEYRQNLTNFVLR